MKPKSISLTRRTTIKRAKRAYRPLGCDNRTVLYAYVDETGDRTPGDEIGNSSIFGMAAVITTETSDLLLREAVRKIRQKFGIPEGSVMSAKKHMKSQARRKYVSELLAGIPDIKVIYCFAVKAEISGEYRKNATIFYNYVAMQTYKRILWAARDWRGSTERIRTSFGHVRGHDYEATSSYFARQIPLETKVPAHMEMNLRWVSASTLEASQAADFYASFLWKVCTSDGDTEFKENIGRIWHQIRTDPKGCPSNLGIFSMPKNELFENAYWNHCPHCKQ